MEKQECLEATVCREIGARTGGEILIGVVGPVRTGKSTLIKQFMEQLVLPAIGPADAKLRVRDELPQSAAGRTIMTTEPKFIPEQAVPLQLEGGGECRIRLIDCVGYMVEGAMGHEEDEKPRMVKSPWFEEEIPFDLAAETGTRKVIRDHSTIGIVVTTDGSISEIPRENYLPAEKRVVEELEALGKPFVILLNSTRPDAPETKALAAELEQAYGRTVLPVSCLDLQMRRLTPTATSTCSATTCLSTPSQALCTTASPHNRCGCLRAATGTSSRRVRSYVADRPSAASSSSTNILST